MLMAIVPATGGRSLKGFRGFNGFSRGMGDVLTEAQRLLTAAGYQGVQCRTERVSFPGIDPNTGLNYYEQNVCSAPGYMGAFDADVIAGGGVNLAAERAYLISQGDGANTGPGYFNDLGGAYNVAVTPGTMTPVMTTNNMRLAENSDAAARQAAIHEAIVREAAAQAGTMCASVLKNCPDGSTVGYDRTQPGCVYLPCPTVGGDGKLPAKDPATDSKNPLSGVTDMFKDIDPTILWLGAAAVAAFMFMGKK